MSKELLKEFSQTIGAEIPEKLVDDISKVEENHYNLITTPEHAYQLMKILYDAGVYHLSTITGMEKENEFHVIYHLQYRIEEEIREIPINFFVTKIDKENPKTPSMVDLFIAADYYEREVYDLYGIYFENHPFLNRIILPEKWPADVHPLRKEYSVEDLKKIASEVVKK